MSRKRTRWTATVSRNGSDQIEKKVALAYPWEAAAVASHYERRGYTVLEVVQGDYRKEVKAPSGARPVPSAVAEAASFLGIEFPVKVRVSNRQHGKNGEHKCVPVGGDAYRSGGYIFNVDSATSWQHEIMVKSWLSPEKMNQVIWHELAHAMQFERDVLCFADSMSVKELLALCKRIYRDGTTYRNKPWEVEAREHEAYATEMKLAR